MAGVEDRVVRENQDAFLVPLSKAVRDELEQFIRNAELILPVLGHRTLESMRLSSAKTHFPWILKYSGNIDVL